MFTQTQREDMLSHALERHACQVLRPMVRCPQFRGKLGRPRNLRVRSAGELVQRRAAEVRQFFDDLRSDQMLNLSVPCRVHRLLDHGAAGLRRDRASESLRWLAVPPHLALAQL